MCFCEGRWGPPRLTPDTAKAGPATSPAPSGAPVGKGDLGALREASGLLCLPPSETVEHAAWPQGPRLPGPQRSTAGWDRRRGHKTLPGRSGLTSLGALLTLHSCSSHGPHFLSLPWGSQVQDPLQGLHAWHLTAECISQASGMPCAGSAGRGSGRLPPSSGDVGSAGACTPMSSEVQ